MNDTIAISPIGSIQTSYTVKSATPVQTALNPSEHGRVVLGDDYCAGLFGLDGFDFVWLLTWLTPSSGDPVPTSLRQIPFLLTDNPREIGLFAMRGPRRPNPIGLHLVRVVEIFDDGFAFAGVDMLDGTPVLDIKPWAAKLDLPHGQGLTGSVRNGWFDEVDLDVPHTPASLRRARGDEGPVSVDRAERSEQPCLPDV